MQSGWLRKSFLLLITGLAVYLSFRYLLSMLIPFLLAYLIAKCLRRPVRFLKTKLHIPTIISGFIGILALTAGLLTGLFCLLRGLVRQLIALFGQFPVYRTNLLERYETLCGGCDRILKLEAGTVHLALESQLEGLVETIQTTLLPRLTEHTLRAALGTAELLTLFIIIVVAALLLIKDMEEYTERFRASFLYPIVSPVLERLRCSGFAYLRTQAIIILFVATICSIGLFIIRNPYALLLGICIAVLDAFPILGSGMILIPWCIVLCFRRSFFEAAILLTVYILCLVLREVLEPKLFGKGIGIRPLYTLAAMYLGIRLFGIAGFLLGPLGLVIIKSVWDMNVSEPPAG